MKKSRFGIVAKTMIAFSGALVILTISLTTATMAPLSEGFEAGGKTSYAAANVTLGTGSWFMDDALTGNLSTDRKTGSWSARIRNLGRVRMNFNKTGAGTVSIQHAVFGTDGSSTWQLWSSTNSGSTWTQVGATITTSSTTLQTANFTVNNSNAIRFEIRKVSGGANRINIDNIQIGDFSSPTPTPTPTSSEHLTMGNPSNAVTDVLQPNNYLMEKPQYSLSYSRDNGGPNWVSWHDSANGLVSGSSDGLFRLGF
jgi:endonuclease G